MKVLGNLNVKVADRERRHEVQKLEVPGVNENEECIIDLSKERSIIVGNT